MNNEKPQSVWENSKIHILLILILSLLVFSPCVSGKFLWDDEHLIVHNPMIKSLKNIPLSFTRSFFYQSFETPQITYYRPLVTILNQLQYALFGLRSVWWHVFNLVLHGINGILFYIFLCRVLKISRKGGFLAAIIYCVHPVHTEAVCFISGRTDLLSLFFLLSSLNLFFIKSKSMKQNRIASVVCFTLGILSKEHVLMFPAAVLGISFMLSEYSSIGVWIRKDLSEILKRLIPFFIITGIYLFVRFFLVRGISVPHYPSGSRSGAWLTMPKVFLHYIRLIFDPDFTLCDYTNSFRIETSPFSFGFLLPVIFAITVFLIGLLYFLRKKTGGFGLFWFFVFLFPVMNIFPLGVWMAERYLYIPMVGIVIFFISLIKKRIGDGEKFTIGVCLLLVLIFSVFSFKRSHLWRDAKSLWSHAVKQNPKNPQARIIYSQVLFSRGEYTKAKQQLIEMDQVPGILKNMPSLSLKKEQTLANIYTTTGEIDAAKESLNRAKSLLPGSSRNLLLEGKILKKQGKWIEAKNAFEKSLEINPNLLSSLIELLEISEKQGAAPKTQLELSQRAIRINPDFPLPYVYKGKALRDLGRTREAIKAFEKFIRMDPNAPEGYLFLADLYETLAENPSEQISLPAHPIECAINTYQELLKRKPNNIDALNNLGVIYARTGNTEMAETLWKKVLEINPRDPTARINLEKLQRSLKNQDQ